MMTKELEPFRKEMEKEAQTWLGSCADDAFIAGVEWMYQRMPVKMDLIKAVLNCRLKIVICAIDYAESTEDRYYYQGKADGYMQAINLLNEKEESIKVEL
jgi:hypothetical protein